MVSRVISIEQQQQQQQQQDVINGPRIAGMCGRLKLTDK